MAAHLQQAVLAKTHALHVWLDALLLGDTREANAGFIMSPCNSNKSEVRTARCVKRLGESSLGMCQVCATKVPYVKAWTHVTGVEEVERREEVSHGILFRLLVCSLTRVTFSAVWLDRKSTRLNSSHSQQSRMPSSA